ncbi:phage portal protein [Amycolatopsis palatopharyngis]|uniref:phage portal protein n=1 Tax=Amycolatopsis palatopharyngis TaxID=187982 RepID=UPI000E266CDA|nr:phage portal protein [Amycolatopsis palatopharyngis]
MGWLTGKTEAKTSGASAPEVKSVGGGAFLSSILGGGSGDEALYPEPGFESHANVGFRRNELVYSCIMEKATSFPEAPLRVYGGDGIGEPRENHPLRVLISNPNAALSEFELMELTSIHLDLAGNAFWEIVLNRAGVPVELWPLRPDRVRIKPQRNGQHEYSYVLDYSREVPLGTDVVHFKLPNPLDPYLGQPALRPALRAVALDNEATDFVKALLQNRAVPGVVIETEQKIDQALTERLEAKWFQKFGGNRRGAPAFLQKGMKPHVLGLNLKDLEFPDLRTISETRICMALGVPPILVGAKAGLDRSTFANYGEARSAFWEETLMPLQQRMQQTIAKKLMPYFETGPRPRRKVVRFDNSLVRALRESEGKRWELATQALRAGGITINQFARQVGLPTNPDADVYLRPAGVIPTDAAGRPLFEQLPGTSPVDEPDEPLTDDQKRIAEALHWMSKGDPPKYASQKRLSASEVKKQVTDAERERFTKAIAKYVGDLQEAIMVDLAKANAKAMAVKAWDVRRWNTALTAVLLAHTTVFARASAREVDPDEDVSIMDGWLESVAASTAAAWNAATQDDVAKAAKEAEWEDAVAHVFEIAATSRAAELATSLATQSSGFGAVDTAKRAGLGTKTWVTSSGDPRSAHARLNGETVSVKEKFSNGARWPGDSSLPDDERINCKCSVIFEEGN